MKNIIAALLLTLSFSVFGQELHEPIDFGGKPFYEITNTKSNTQKCLDAHIFVDRSIVDSVGIVAAQIVINKAVADFEAIYDAINITMNTRLEYLDVTFEGSSNSQIFYNFINTPFVGDFAQLFTFRGSGGIAAINQLTRQYPYAVSTLQNRPGFTTRNQFWNALVGTHEPGHIIGARHTHDPAWNGNNTPIDSCAYGVVPTAGTSGTIMSYCHLLGRTELVFHPQVIAHFHGVLDALGFYCSPPEPECDEYRIARIIMNKHPQETTWRWGGTTGGPYPKDSVEVLIRACAGICDTLFVYDSAGDGFMDECMIGYLYVDGEEYIFEGDTMFVEFCAPPPPPPYIPCIDISSPVVYSPQVTQPGIWLFSGNTLTLRGNLWVSVAIEHYAEENSVLSFEVFADGVSEFQAVAASPYYNPFAPTTIYNLAGRHRYRNMGYRVVLNTWTTVNIPLPAGQKSYLWLINDDDFGSNRGEVSFRNICIVEKESIPENNSEMLFNVLGVLMSGPRETLPNGVYFTSKGEKVVIIR